MKRLQSEQNGKKRAILEKQILEEEKHVADLRIRTKEQDIEIEQLNIERERLNKELGLRKRQEAILRAQNKEYPLILRIIVKVKLFFRSRRRGAG